MPVAVDDVRRIAELAGLALDDPETERFAAELSKIVDYAEILSGAGANREDTATPPVAPENRLRPDVVGGTLTPGEVLAAAPESDGCFFRVPGFLPDE